MKIKSFRFVASFLLAGVAGADPDLPGSVLFYPVVRDGSYMTIVSVTNTNRLATSGTTDVRLQYVSVVTDVGGTVINCAITEQVETLTPADTFNVLTDCHTPANSNGYLVVSATNPAVPGQAWSHNQLIGSEIVIGPLGSAYSLDAIAFDAMRLQHQPTDLDGDGELDFDGVEYEPLPDELYFEFLASSEQGLALINLTGGPEFTTNVEFVVFNDNEVQFSASTQVRCWANRKLTDYALVFDNDFLRNNTPHDPTELDLDCDNIGDVETGWARIRGQFANSSSQSIASPAILAAVTAGLDTPSTWYGRGTWRGRGCKTNGDFLNFGPTDAEYPQALTGSTPTISLTTGGTLALTLAAGPAQANRVYLVLGSASGTSPGLPVDNVVLPINFDAYTSFTLQNANSALLPNTLGVLDAAGQASAAVVFPAGLGSALLGTKRHFAYAAFTPSGSAQFASNAVPLTFAP